MAELSVHYGEANMAYFTFVAMHSPKSVEKPVPA
jgi:hypothetical protein